MPKNFYLKFKKPLNQNINFKKEGKLNQDDKKESKLIKEIKRFKKRIRKDPKRANKFLVQAGIIDKKGHLRSPYRD